MDCFLKLCLIKRKDFVEKTDEIFRLLNKCWEADKLLTIKMIFFIRDCRGGLGQRWLFQLAINWMVRNHIDDLKKNIIHIPFYGRYRDLFLLFGTPLENDMLDFYVFQINEDMSKIRKTITGSDSLPTE